MASVYTSNLAIEQPANGDYVGTWDVPVNSNMSAIDLAVGTIQAIGLAAGSVTLSTAQARSAFLNFTGNLVASVTVTIPGLSSSPGTVVSGKGYTVQNQCGNSSAFTVTLATTVAGQQQIALPPYEPVDILIEGTNSSQAGSIKFRNLGRVGTYWDYAGSSVPAWVTGCTVPPYLNCTGAAFSSATYPALATVLGGTTLPDARGRGRFTNNQGTGRITTAISGVNGDTNFSVGGSESLQSHDHGGVTATADMNSSATLGYIRNITAGGGTTPMMTDVLNATVSARPFSDFLSSDGSSHSHVINSTGAGASQNMPPAYIGGLTLIRSA